MRLKDIIKTQSDIDTIGYDIANNVITHVNINIIAHFGNVTSFEIACKDVWPMSCYNNTGNLGFVIRSFIELFELSKEDGIHIDEIKNVPCRLIFESTNGYSWGAKCIGMGHFIKDKFVFIQDFAKVDQL